LHTLFTTHARYAAIAEEARLRETEEGEARLTPTSTLPPTSVLKLAPPPKRNKQQQQQQSSVPLEPLAPPPLAQAAAAAALSAAATSSGVSSTTDQPGEPGEDARWYHGIVDRETAEARITRNGIANGRFLVRRRDAAVEEYVSTLPSCLMRVAQICVVLRLRSRVVCAAQICVVLRLRSRVVCAVWTNDQHTLDVNGLYCVDQ
jgi:hypothetical protein